MVYMDDRGEVRFNEAYEFLWDVGQQHGGSKMMKKLEAWGQEKVNDGRTYRYMFRKYFNAFETMWKKASRQRDSGFEVYIQRRRIPYRHS